MGPALHPRAPCEVWNHSPGRATEEGGKHGFVPFLPAGGLAPSRSRPRPEQGGRRRHTGAWSWQRGTFTRGGTRCGHTHCPVPREATRRPGHQAGGRQARPRSPALGVSPRGTFSKRLTRRAPEARCGSQVSITWTQLTATVPGSAGSAGSVGSAAPSRALSRRRYPHSQVPPPSSSGTQTGTRHKRLLGGADTRGGVDAAGPRASADLRGRGLLPPWGRAVPTATLRPPGSEVATRRGPRLRTRKRAVPSALHAAL